MYFKCSSKGNSGRKQQAGEGRVEPIPDVTAVDPYRREFVRRFRSDADFRCEKIGFSPDGNVEEFLRKYEAFVRPGARNVPAAGSAECETCVALYDLGINLGPVTDQTSIPKSARGALREEEYFRVETAVSATDGDGQQHQQQLVLPESSLRPWDATHEQDFPDDVTRITAFSEASLLLAIRRRFENLQIYTYVGDIVISVNPYMRLPEVVRINKPPQQYGLGRDPNAYATAFFAYWGQMRTSSAGGAAVPRTPDAGNTPLRQSCIVSGESGAGKTYCCGRVMKFLNALSKQRESLIGPSSVLKRQQQQQQKQQAHRSGGAKGNSQRGSISDLVEDVSPFLEAFGNAKTKRNDNSSRFGKFMEILFDDGRVVGARIKHYLLEKSRAVSQGRGERSFHIFYQMLKGMTPEERGALKLHTGGDCAHYDNIMRGGTHTVDADDVGADVRQFTNPYVPGDPDSSGVRASLVNANCSPQHLSGVWAVLAALLKLGNVNFRDADGVAQSGSGSQPAGPADLAELEEIAQLLHVSLPDAIGGGGGGGAEPASLTSPTSQQQSTASTAGRYLGDMLCINRRIIQGKALDSDVAAVGAAQNRDALVKDLYARLFEFIVQCANDVLGAGLPNELFREMETSVSILDIFGFEVFQKNSLEQLFINFANEKLQNEFNKYIFEQELTLYEREGLLDQSTFDFSYQNNTECCNLIEARKRKPLFIGVLPLLEDQGQSLESTDEGFCRQLIKLFGRGVKNRRRQQQRGGGDGGGGGGGEQADHPNQQAMTNEKNKKKKKKKKKPGDYFFAKKGGGNQWFGILHFAGEVIYHVDGFIQKNQDRVPVQLTQLLAANTAVGSFVREQLYESSSASTATSTASPKRKGKGGGKGGGKGNSISSKFVSNIADLAKRLRQTTPHYIRCVKPNDFKLRPIDGRVAFDAFKVYEQLLYAGVMEVVRVKKEGYPFRMTYEDFWRDRVQRDGVARLMQLDPSLNAREGADVVCRRVVEDLAQTSHTQGPGQTERHHQSQAKQTWILGRTMLFAKHTLPAGLRRWTQNRVSNTLRGFVRFHGNVVGALRASTVGLVALGLAWRKRIAVRKYERVVPAVRMVQTLARACVVRAKFEHAISAERAVRRVQAALRRRLVVVGWRRVAGALQQHKKVGAVAKAQVLVQSLCAAAEFHRLRAVQLARLRAAEVAQYLARCLIARGKWAANMDSFKRFQVLRRLMAGSAVHARLIMRVVRAQQRKRQDAARAFIASNLLTSARRTNFVILRGAAIVCQRRVRCQIFRRFLVRRRLARVRMQAFARLTLVLRKLWACHGASARIQAHWRGYKVRRRFARLLRMVKSVQLKFLRTNFRKTVARWLLQAEAAIFAGDATLLARLVECSSSHFAALRGCTNLINVCDRVRGTTCLHMAVRAGRLPLVQYLVRNGANPHICDVDGNTPLHAACQAGDAAHMVINYLVTTSAAPLTLTRNSVDQTPLMVATSSGAPTHHVVRTLRLQMDLDAAIQRVSASLAPAKGPRRPHMTDDDAFSAFAARRQEARRDGGGGAMGAAASASSSPHRVLSSRRRRRMRDDLVGDELVMAQLLLLHDAGTIDPATYARKVRRRNAAAVRVQQFVRKCKARWQYRQHAVRRARAAEIAAAERAVAVNMANNTNPAIAARIEAMRKRRAAMQERLTSGLAPHAAGDTLAREDVTRAQEGVTSNGQAGPPGTAASSGVAPTAHSGSGGVDGVGSSGVEGSGGGGGGGACLLYTSPSPRDRG